MNLSPRDRELMAKAIARLQRLVHTNAQSDALRVLTNALDDARRSAVAPTGATPTTNLPEIDSSLVVGASEPVAPKPDDEVLFDYWHAQFPDMCVATRCLVWNFALALGSKLAAAEKKYGYSDGWRDKDWEKNCQAKLLEHVGKGDPRDVAAYCAFMWAHGWKTVPSAAQPDWREPLEALAAKWAQDAESFAYSMSDGTGGALETALLRSYWLEETTKRNAAEAKLASAVSDGHVVVPRELTAENGAKGALIGEFLQPYVAACVECNGEGDNCHVCNGEGIQECKVTVEWTTIKEIWKAAIAHFAAAPSAGKMAEPAEPMAKHWRQAILNFAKHSGWLLDDIEQRARELAGE
jgi:hypothetical protein